MILFTAVSANKKTGAIPVTGSESKTCPATCPFNKTSGDGCYAKYGPIFWHWRRLDAGLIGIQWKEFISKIQHLHRGQLWRHNVFGDLKQKNGTIDSKSLEELTNANKNKAGFCYTHHDVLTNKTNRKTIAKANANGFTVNLSGNNVENADKLKALGIAPVVTVVPQDSANSFSTPAGNKVIVCPAQTRENVNCASCRLCQNQKRSVIIGFKPHGMGAKYVEQEANAA